MNPNPTPKARFLENPSWVSKHRELIVSDAFLKATDYGMSQYQVLLSTQVNDGNTAMAAGYKLQGALEFLETLRQLSEPPKLMGLVVRDQLDHTV